MTIDAAVVAMPEQVALPRRNGELVFAEPWESRAFGMAVALHEQRLYAWDEFRDRLVEEVEALGPDDGRRYYACWLAAFERVLVEQDAVTVQDIEARARALAEQERHPHRH